MSRLSDTFARLRAESRCALIPFVTAGDPDAETTLATMHAMVDAGADVIELGVPFSDPMADGPVIQKASERALAAGMSVDGVFELVRQFRVRDEATPVVLMGYLNPVEMRGYETFSRGAAQAGVDGALIVDLPPEEAPGLRDALASRSLDLIFLLSPTSDDDRIQLIADQASGYIYYVSLKGVTGASTLDVDSVAERVSRIGMFTNLPIGVGFGIGDAPTAARVAAVSDAVVVGSVLVRQVEKLGQEPHKIATAVAHIVGEMRLAMDTARQARPS